MTLIDFIDRHANIVGFLMILIMIAAVINEARKSGTP